MTFSTLEDLKSDDVFDSRDVMARISELEDRQEPVDGKADPLSEDEADELATLRAFADEASSYTPEWESGATFVRDSHFEQYARELAEDIGAISEDNRWPLTYIDWERAANALRADYAEVDLDGVPFWVRS